MKIYLIDKYNDLNKLVRELNMENIEKKDDCKFKMTKNDYVIMSDKNNFDGLDKLKNIIVLVEDKDYKHVWNIVNSYKTLDVIDIKMPVDYLAKRIRRVVKSEL